ncbi:unnamed protein product [Arctia plantaginis]|uniref:CUB domain-containing protein n=1 Tax=Arctia plantaginis TaxID=874455 RepID=A0A8S1B189_ARCPL|nr:unnamed protein product [Arctia plantaginis]
MIENPDSHCDYLIRVPNRQMITVANAEWPSPYLPNLICRWVFDCPSGYACRLRCRDVGLPKTHGCFLDRLMVSTSGNLDLSDAHVYCGGKKVNARSIGSRMVMGLVTSETSPGGRFRCKVRPEPWV